MNKYLLSLLLFGFVMTDRMYAQEGGSGSEGGDSGSGGEGSDSGGEGSDSGSGGEGSDGDGGSGSEGGDSGSEGGDSGSEGGSGSGSGGGSGGSVMVDPNYVIDKYTFDDENYAPNPYPLDECVQISLYDDGEDQMYAIFECNSQGTKVTKTFYTNDNCNETSSAPKVDFELEGNYTLGDLETFYCDGDDYSFKMAIDCSGQNPSGDTIQVVPYVCYFDGTSSKTISNQWACTEDDAGNKIGYFFKFDDDYCEELGSEKNVTEECSAAEDGPYTSNVAGDNYPVKILNNDWNCPDLEAGDDDDDDDDSEGDIASIISINNGVMMALAVSALAWLQ